MQLANHEREIKLTLSPQTLSRIQKAGALSRLPGIKPMTRSNTRVLVATYWDTPDHALAKAGIGLRIRREGSQMVQTLKAETGQRGLITDRTEDNVVISLDDTRPGDDDLKVAPTPDLARVVDPVLHDAALRAIGGTPLKPVFETCVTRIARTYEASSQARSNGPDGARFEVVFDVGEVSAPGSAKMCPICEIEIEHLGGPVGILFEVASALAEKYPLKVAATSKAALGYELARAVTSPDEASDAQPVMAGRSPVKPGMTIAQAYGTLLGKGAAQLAGNQLVVLQGHNPAGIHQMRVAIRRMRAAHSAFKAAINLPGERAFVDDMRKTFACLGAARDLDVFCIETIPDLVLDCAGAGPDLAALAAAAQELRAAAWSDVEACVDAAEFTQMLLKAGSLAVQAPEIAPKTTSGRRKSYSGMSLEDFARQRLQKRHAQVISDARSLADMQDEARHDLRKRLKALRYEAAFFAPLWPRLHVKAFMRPLKILQDEFGALNDAAIAASLAHRAARSIGGDRANEAAGFVAGWYGARAQTAFRDIQAKWPDFEALPVFWRLPVM